MVSARKAASLTGVERRAVELDTIASVLPLDRRDEFAELLTDADIQTLRYLVNEGTLCCRTTISSTWSAQSHVPILPH